MCAEEKENKPFQSNDFDKWLENLFLDPFTSILDQYEFRVDLYDTENEIIVEAMLTPFSKKEITINIEDDKMRIRAGDMPRKERTLTFPFTLRAQKITASFECGILEIFISKRVKVEAKNRKIYI